MGGIIIKRVILVVFLLLLTGCSNSTPQIEFSTVGHDASIHDDLLVASDFKSLKVIDLKTGEPLKTIEVPNEYGVIGFDIYENYVVWADSRNHALPLDDNEDRKTDIFLYDIKTDETKQITSNTSSSPLMPKIWENYIIWQDNNASEKKQEFPDSWQLYLYDINTGQEKIITHSLTPYAYASYEINENKVVWEDERNLNLSVDDIIRGGDNEPEYNKDIYLYDITLDKEIAIATGPFMESKPAIFEDIIVWEDRNAGRLDADIVMLNISTGERENITKDRYNQATPKIYGNYIVWMDERNGGSSNDVYVNGKAPNSDVFMYDIESRKEILMTGNEPQILPNISQYWLIFIMSRQVEPQVQVVKLRK